MAEKSPNNQGLELVKSPEENGKQIGVLKSNTHGKGTEVIKSSQSTKSTENKGDNKSEKAVDKSGESGISFMSNSTEYSQIAVQNVGEINVTKVDGSKFSMFTDDYADKKAIELAEKNLEEIQSVLPNDFEMPNVAVSDFEKSSISSNAIAGYDKETNTMWVNSKYNSPEKIVEYVAKNKGEFANTTQQAPYLHELGHKYYEDCIKALAKSENMKYNKAMELFNKYFGGAL